MRSSEDAKAEEGGSPTPGGTLHVGVDASAAKPDASGAVPAVKAPVQEASLAASLPIILFWIAMSCSVILFNKYLYMTSFKFPLTLTAIHMGFATLATSALKLTGHVVVPPSVQQGWRFWARNVLPIGLLFAASLGTSNLAAMRLTVSFIQMVKALTPMLALAISVAMKMETATRTLVAVVSIMCLGVTIASYGELDFDAPGLILQLVSITAEAARLVATQNLLQVHLKGSSPLVSLSMFAPCCLFFLLPIALVSEPAAIAALGSAWMVVLLNTLTAFTLNVAVVMLVSATSGLTLTLAGIIKDILLIAASVVLLGSTITFTQIGGYTLALYGLNMYHGYRAWPKDGSMGAPVFRDIAWHAATDRLMQVMGGGMLLLSTTAVSGTPAGHA